MRCEKLVVLRTLPRVQFITLQPTNVSTSLHPSTLTLTQANRRHLQSSTVNNIFSIRSLNWNLHTMSSFSRVLKAMAIVVLCLAAIIRAVPVADSDAYALVHALSIVDDGVVHLGHDGTCSTLRPQAKEIHFDRISTGVLRSYHGNGSVCDYAKLHPHQIQQLVTGHDHTEGLIAIFKGVDGHDVKDEAQLLKQAEFVVLSKERRSEEGRSYLPQQTYHHSTPLIRDRDRGSCWSLRNQPWHYRFL